MTVIKSPRLIYIARSPIPSEQANSIQVAKMCAGFARHVAVELVAPRRVSAPHGAQSLWERYAVPPAFGITQLPYPHWGNRFAVRGYAFAAAAYALLRGYRFAYTRDPWAAYCLSRAGVRTGFEAHDVIEDQRYPIWTSLIRGGNALPGLRGIFCISRTLMEDYRAAGADADRLHVAPDGVDLERFQPEKTKAEARSILGIDPGVTLLCHCGHLYPGRGGEELVEALAGLPAIDLLMVGGSPADIERVRDVARAKGVDGRIRWEGTVSNARIPLYLWAADILIMPYTSRVPTRRAMSPLKMFEYMAAARPIVATDFPTIREVLTDADNAVLVEPDDPQALAAGIRRIRNDAALADRIASQARRDSEAYTWDRRAYNILAALTS
jgi:glycosyltransferase involved in cell wall biosynthesis